MNKYKETVGVHDCAQNGITLIALVITIIVMLILVAVTISMAINGGLFDYAGKASGETKNAIEKEQELANGKVQIDGVWYNSIDDYLNNKPAFDAEEWDEDAAPEDIFICQSDDPTDEEYGIVIGYTENIQSYTTLRFPSRCKKIIIDDSNGSEIRSYTKSVKEIELPNTVVEIGYNAFDEFEVLQKVIIPESVVSIGEGAFRLCSSLTGITIPDSVTYIGYWAFAGCSSLMSVTIPNSVTTIEMGAFSECSSLTSITIPNSITTIFSMTFSGCTELTNVTIPESITNINAYAFNGCSSLTSVTIPDGVTSIETDAFYGVQHIYYNGSATGSPWGALSMN